MIQFLFLETSLSSMKLDIYLVGTWMSEVAGHRPLSNQLTKKTLVCLMQWFAQVLA